MVRGLDVSPVVLVPASERSKRSIYSSPIFMSKKDGSSPDMDAVLRARRFKASPRRLFADSGLPTPLTDRLESSKNYHLPETPLRAAFTPRKSRESDVFKKMTPWRPAISPFKASAKPPLNSFMGAIELADEDPFDETYKSFLVNELLDQIPDSPPDSGPECESPVLRSSQLGPSLSQSSASAHDQYRLSKRSRGGVGLGIGLLEGFSLKESSGVKSSPGTLMDATLGDDEPSSSRRDSKRSRMFADFSTGSPVSVAPPAKKPKRAFLMDAILDGDGDLEMRDTFHLKKRRRTVTSRE